MHSDCRPLVHVLLVLLLISAAAPAIRRPASHVLDRIQATFLHAVDTNAKGCAPQACRRLALLRDAMNASHVDLRAP